MKMEHKAIIERAQSMDLLPSELAHELLVHDLVDSSLFELRNIKAPYHKLSEQHQQEVIDRITEKVTDAVKVAIGVIASRGSITIPCDMKRIQVDAKHLTITAMVDGKDPNRHSLTDSAGHLCLLVMAPEDYAEGLDFIQPDRDQGDLPLSAADIASGMGLFNNTDTGTAPASTLEQVETLIDEADTDSAATAGPSVDEIYAYIQTRKDHIDAGYLQSRFAISSDEACSILLQLLGSGDIELDVEGDTPLDNQYKVINGTATVALEVE